MSKLIGGSALRARLANIAAVPPAFTAMWADETVDDIRRTKPHSTRPASNEWKTKSSPTRGGVYGAFWWVFVDRGTKAHDIEVRKATVLSNRPRGATEGGTIFGKKVHLKRMRRRPFISKAAQEALSTLGSDIIVKAWNGRKIRGPHTKFL